MEAKGNVRPNEGRSKKEGNNKGHLADQEREATRNNKRAGRRKSNPSKKRGRRGEENKV